MVNSICKSFEFKMKIKEPPKLINTPFQVVYSEYTEDIEKYMAIARATLPDGRR